MAKTSRTFPADHPLIGTWITDEEDSDTAFRFSLENNKLRVSGFCRSSGEEFEITHVKWDGMALSFIARFPATDTVTKNLFRMRPDGRGDLELTNYEVWKKKDVTPGEIPEAWRTRSPTVRFGATTRPLAHARGSEPSYDREGVVSRIHTKPHGRRPRAGRVKPHTHVRRSRASHKR